MPIFAHVKKLFHISILLPLLMLGSCIRPTTLDPGVDAEIIVNCLLVYPKGYQELSLQFPTSLSGEKGKEITDADATATLSDDTTGESLGQFQYVGSSEWFHTRQLVPGHSYSLTVQVEGRPTITASTTVPTMNWVEPTADFHYSVENPGDGVLWIYALADGFDNSQRILVDEIGTDSEYADPFNLIGDSPYHRRFLRMEPVPASFHLDLDTDMFPSGRFVFLFCSKEYDLYLRNVVSYQIRLLIDDVTTLYDSSNIYNNIQGGIGIFGAAITCSQLWQP